MRQFDALLDKPFEENDGKHYRPFQYYPPPCPISKAIKRELRQIGGTTPDGRPILRMGWGMDIKWWYEGRQVVRYVMSRKTEEREVKRNGIIGISRTTRYWGRPYFIVEEWKPATFFKPPGLREEDAQQYWDEHHRFKGADDDEPEPPPSSGFKSIGEYKEWLTARRQRRLLLTGTGRRDPKTGAGEVIQERVDLWGPFPRSGRYEYLCQLAPPGTHPNADFLRTIREAWHLKNHRRFVSVDQELDAWQEGIALERSASRLKQTLKMEEDLMLHWHPFDVSPNKGGTGQSTTYLPGKVIDFQNDTSKEPV